MSDPQFSNLMYKDVEDYKKIGSAHLIFTLNNEAST